MTSEITLNNLAGKHSAVISNMYDTATHTTQNWTLRMKEILNLGSHISCKLLTQPRLEVQWGCHVSILREVRRVARYRS